MSKTDFDLMSFGANIIETIDSIRSVGKTNSSNPDESRINAFYRALGLPAIVIDEKSIPDEPFNNGNIFVKSDVSIEAISALSTRESAFKKKIEEEEINNFLDVNKASILDSIVGRKRGTLFPMIANAAVIVKPQNRRVAGAFFVDDKEITFNDTIYRRPLIETIIFIRLKSESGEYNTDLSNKLLEDFGKSGDIFKNIKINEAASILLERLVDVLSSLRTSFQTILFELGQTRDEVRKTFKTSINSNPESNPEEQQSEDGSLESMLKKQQEEQQYKEAVMVVFEYDDSLKADRDKNEKIARNMRDAVCASSFLKLISSDDLLKKDIEETKEKIQKVTQEQKKNQQMLDLLLGVFGGLSALDVIAVVFALFTIPMKNLLGLLNTDAFDRLKTIKSGTNIETPGEVTESIDVLQDKVQQILEYIDGNISLETIFDDNTKEAV